MIKDKRGQVTIFVILGIVIVALVVLLLAFKDEVIPKPATIENLDSTMKDIDKHVKECMSEAAEDPIKRIGMQGGYLATPENSYRRWNDYTVSYLCYNLPATELCQNRMLTREKMEEQLAAAIKENMGKCLDIEGAAGGGLFKRFDIVLGNEMTLKVSIERAKVGLELSYEVTLKPKGTGDSRTQKIFVKDINVPLGDLYEVSQDIIDSETSIGRFDQLTYMLSKMSKYTIDVQKPYPDKIYKINLREGSYIFQFAVEGEPS